MRCYAIAGEWAVTVLFVLNCFNNRISNMCHCGKLAVSPLLCKAQLQPYASDTPLNHETVANQIGYLFNPEAV